MRIKVKASKLALELERHSLTMTHFADFNGKGGMVYAHRTFKYYIASVNNNLTSPFG